MSQNFDDLAAEFLARHKIASNRPRWRSSQHPDYAEAAMVVAVPDTRIFRGRVTLIAHRVRDPAKYSFSLLFRSERILALDVNPARFHRNLLLPAKIGGTHWQRWPTMEAEPDGRDQRFSLWLQDFLRRANVSTKFGVLSPPRGVQLELSRQWRRP
jgi:hypothetical protein